MILRFIGILFDFIGHVMHFIATLSEFIAQLFNFIANQPYMTMNNLLIISSYDRCFFDDSQIYRYTF